MLTIKMCEFILNSKSISNIYIYTKHIYTQRAIQKYFTWETLVYERSRAARAHAAKLSPFLIVLSALTNTNVWQQMNAIVVYRVSSALTLRLRYDDGAKAYGLVERALLNQK